MLIHATVIQSARNNKQQSGYISSLGEEQFTP